MDIARAAMIGDVVGQIGLEILEAKLLPLIKEHKIDFVTVNGENAAGGFGMTEKDYLRIIAAGADVVTSGNHIWEKREFWAVLENEEKMLRPANYPPGTPYTTGIPGTGCAHVYKNGIDWFVVNLQGREMMNAVDCPFQCFDRLEDLYISKVDENHPLVFDDGDTTVPCAFPLVLVDFHAESSREKEALSYHIDGRASLVAGTHTHVQTADEKILPKGTAYITDLGMTGITDSVIGMDPDICMNRFRKQVMYQMEVAPANSLGQMQGVIVDFNVRTGRAISIRRI